MKLILFLFTFIYMGCSHKTPNSLVSYNAELDGFKYPFPVKTYSLRSHRQILDFRYMDISPKTKTDKTIVLLHGKNFSGYYWERIALDLIKKNYRVIIPDQIGFGKSSKPESYNYSFSQFSLNTMKLIASLGIEKFTLVGHSMGGMLGVHMTDMYPKHVERLVLINPVGLEDYLEYVDYKDSEFFFNNEKNKTIAKFRNYQRKNYYDGRWSDEYEKLLAPFKGWKNGKDFIQLAWVNALTYHPIFAEPMVSKFKNISTPVSLIIGTRDRTGPGRGWKKAGVSYKLGQYQKLGKLADKLFPNSQLFELHGIGHMPQFENYSRFSQSFNKALK